VFKNIKGSKPWACGTVGWFQVRTIWPSIAFDLDLELELHIAMNWATEIITNSYPNNSREARSYS
jgi:hypothetical protein